MLQGAGVAEALPFETRADGRVRCDPLGCLVDMGAEAGSWLAGGSGRGLDQGRQLALALTAEAVLEDCRRAAFVVLLSGPESCANGTPSLGGRALWQSGGVAVRWRGERVGIERVVDERGQRPWTR